MNAETIRAFALKMQDVIESFPFDEVTLVFKVNGKMFLLLALDAHPLQFNVKCDPDEAVSLRDQYPDNILPGYHMNKTHWNTIMPEGLPSKMVYKMIEDSYQLVTVKTKKRKKG